MKKAHIFILITFAFRSFAQNTFPGTGNVGIGTTSPSYSLDVNGTFAVRNTGYFYNSTTYSYESSTNSYLGFRTMGGVGHFWMEQAKPIAFQANGGNVGIGTNQPLGILHINSNTPNVYLTGGDYAAIRGNGETWLFGYGGTPGNEDISIGTQDNTGNRTLTLAAGGYQRLRILSNGHIGIGNSNPQRLLTIGGGVTPVLGLKNTDGLGWSTYLNGNGDFSIYEYTSSDWNSGGDRLTISKGGNVGIGTNTTGTHKLAVEGSIGAREIKVEASGWSDFVFEDDYHLRPLEEIEKYISQNKHLPDMPSEGQVINEGINLGEMNAKLLQKIEELTLYLIEQNKELKSANLKIEELENAVMALSK